MLGVQKKRIGNKMNVYDVYVYEEAEDGWDGKALVCFFVGVQAKNAKHAVEMVKSRLSPKFAERAVFRYAKEIEECTTPL